MSVGSWALWGFVATVLLTMLMEGAQGVGITRMSLPYLLGTMVTPDRDRAKVLGFVIHLVFGMALSLLYVAIFASTGGATWWKGGLIGLGHAAFVLTVGMVLLPGMHPRVASETHGPDAARQLEPPGFLALHYGAQTPLTVLVAHVLFGVVLGGFY